MYSVLIYEKFGKSYLMAMGTLAYAKLVKMTYYCVYLKKKHGDPHFLCIR